MKNTTLSLCAGLLGLVGSVCALGQTESVVLESDGWEIHGLWQPVDDSRTAALVLHQAAGDREDFASLADALSGRGLSVLRLELRGHGESANLGRFAPPYSENLHINEGAWRDIVVAIDWLRRQPEIVQLALVAASYSGEQAALAYREGDRRADAYVLFSPGNFQDDSIAAIDPSDAPWLFVRTEEESPGSLRWIDEIYALLPERAPSAEIWILPGGGHAADILSTRNQLADDVAMWLRDALDSPPGN